MKCALCNGTGIVQNYFKQDTVCPDCLGTGVVTITNEQWFCSLSTQEKAQWIFNDRVEQSDGWYEQCGHTVNEVLDWLNEEKKE